MDTIRENKTNIESTTKETSNHSHAFRIKDNAGSAYGKRKEPLAPPTIENNNCVVNMGNTTNQAHI